MTDLGALVLASLALLFAATALAVGVRQLRALVGVTPGPLQEPLLVVIPARNEGARIGAQLTALLRETSPLLHVLVVDDRSTDDTAAVVEAVATEHAARVTLLHLDADPPPGVYGKPHALRLAVEAAHARGLLTPRVLFLDADVHLSPGALGGIVAAHRASGATALSGVPALVCTSAVEQLLVPALASVVTGRFTPTRVHDAHDPTAFLNGQLIVVDAQALADAGGWAACEHSVLEDVALARNLKARGGALRLADLRAVASTRMYESFAAIDAGFGKNATALLGKSAGVVGVFAFLLSLLPWTAVGLSLWATPVVVVTMVLQAAARRLAGAPVWPVLVLPVVYLGVAAVLVRASLRRTITWRGRSYAQ